MDVINIGYSCYILKSRVIAVVESSSSPIKRLVQDARDKGTLIDATYGKKTKSVIVMDSDHVILSSRSSEYILNMKGDDSLEPDDE